ncbi:MAG: hypothetical protein HN474_03370 [Nitrospina sp.]|nr:hypothetical protein [Nitrospina sp.]
MLIFTKDISKRDFIHSAEDQDLEIKKYMDYQRSLFPYTIIRGGLDLAYKEIDDILNYQDNGNQPPSDSNRQEYPSDIPDWYQSRFPWTANFIKIEDIHILLVILITAMDSFRTHEKMNTYHLMVIYDSVFNIVNLYNDLLKESPEKARDIHLSQNEPVFFDDFINNYWPHIDLMILSQPDFEHAKHLNRKKKIELEIQQRMADGEEPIKALQNTSKLFNIDQSSLNLLERNKVLQRFLELEVVSLEETSYDLLNSEVDSGTKFGVMSHIDSDFLINLHHQKNSQVNHQKTR